MFRLDSEVLAAERQAALYAYLLSRGDKWTPMMDAAADLLEYPDWSNPATSFHNTTARRWMTKDIEAINSSDRFEKIIISGSRGIKLATEEEFSRFIEAEYKEIFRKLSRVRRIGKKGNLDQQASLSGNITEAFMRAHLSEEATA